MGKFLRSLRAAWAGLADATRRERNFRFHLLAAASTLFAGAWLGLAPWEWVAVILAIAGVLSAELFNSAIERLADRIHAEHDPLIGRAKDCAAAATLVVSLAALWMGGVIFVPKVSVWLRDMVGW